LRGCAGNLAPVPPATEDARPSYAELEALIAQQAERIAELEALVVELRAQLGQNSRNSSKPPSSDGYAKPEANKNRSLRRRSGRKPGGQPGHQGHHLERREDPDRAVVHAV
jgi:transposase